jgi:hypothetical protein
MKWSCYWRCASVSCRYSWGQQAVFCEWGGKRFDGLPYHEAQTAHSRGCKSDRRVSVQCYGVRLDGSTGRRSGVGPGFDGLSLFTIGPRKVFIYNRTSKSLWIKIFFRPELVMVPFRLMFVKLQKKKSRLAPQKVCSVWSTHTRLPRFFQGE